MSSRAPTHDDWMKSALKLAARAAENGEVPVGAVIVHGDQIIARGFNRRETRKRPTAHAELLAIEAASRKRGAWRLEDTTLYVTLEPCLMCWGAILLARIPRVIFGAVDPKAGVCGSLLSLHEDRRFNHHPKVQGGLLAEPCGRILSDFFKRLRKEKRLGR